MYAERFESNTVHPALPVRVALGALIIKQHKPSREERQDERDRIEVERFFSLDKRCNCAGLIMTKLSDTTLNTIALTVLVTNLFQRKPILFLLSISWTTEPVSSSNIIWRSIQWYRRKKIWRCQCTLIQRKEWRF